MFILRRAQMKRSLFFAITAVTVVAASACLPIRANDTPEAATVQVKMLVTVQETEGKKIPDLKPEDIIVKQGDERFKVTEWAPATGENGALNLFILLDDASNPRIGSFLSDLRTFIQAQPATTLIGVGYMSNATVQIVQDPTNDHEKASHALRMPLGNPGAYGSPYLSLSDLIERWPDRGGRREVLMITDGVDRFRSQYSRLAALSPSPDLDSTSMLCQRAGILVHSIYVRGTGHRSRNYWILNGGQNGLAQLADESGGEAFFLGFQNPVSFKPYLDQLQSLLDHQYWLQFEMKPGKKAELRSVDVDSEISGIDIVSPNGVLVPAGL